MTQATLRGRLRRLALVLPLLWGAERAQADEGIPALLQFAEQYRDTQHADVPEKPAKTPVTPALPKTARPATAPATLSDSPTLRRALQARDAQLAKQQTLLQRQEKELATLRQSLAAETARHQQALTAAQSPAQTAANPADWAPLQKLVSGLRQAASGMPDEQRAAALTARLEKEKAALTARLSTKEEQRTALEEKAQDMQVAIEQKEATLSALRLENTALQERQTTLKEQAGKAEAQLAEQAQTLHQAQVDVAALQSRAKWLAKPQTLSKPAGQQAYAAGGALGRDILAMLDERKGWGIDMERQTVLAGVVDAFAGQYQLTTDVLTRALAESEAAVNTARAKAIAGQQKKGESFVADFKKQTGVKQSPAGFWYRVDYAGDAPLRDADIVDVVVKEALTDGTVIQDMSLSGNVLSQPLSAYPPLFREAIGHLKNHGSLTMVVPPALAYGEDGYPPKVPPNATMVYELRIDNSKAAPGA